MKPLKETIIGKFLSNKNLGHLLEDVGDFVPTGRVLERVKDLVLGDRSLLGEDDKKEFMEIYKLNLEALSTEMEDRANARTREKEFVAATGRIDWFMTGFGFIILLCFVYTVVVSAMGNIPAEMREIFIESRAAVRDIVLAIAAYYWGSSAGSRVKDMKRGFEERPVGN
jgi:hypothetical protein